MLAVVVAVPALALVVAPPEPAPATTGAPPAGRALQVVEGGILAPVPLGDPVLRPCLGPEAQGVVGFTIPRVTPGANFAILATDPNADVQDLEIRFAASCLEPLVPAPVTNGAYGDEVGHVPEGAAMAVAWLAQGGQATFRYVETPGPPPPTHAFPVTNALHFRQVRVVGAESTLADMYEPHMVVSGTGAIYLAGHTAVVNSHRSHVVVSTDDGATWRRLPDVQPLPPGTAGLPLVGGRVGQGNEGGIAADDAGRAWLYDVPWVAGSAPLYGWCDDGARACSFDPAAFDFQALATTPCPRHPAPRVLDKPWARAGDGKVLLANAGLRNGFVDESGTAVMLGVVDVATGAKAWNVCVAVGGMPGVPAIRDRDGHIAIPHLLRTAEGEGYYVVHYGPAPGAMATSEPLFQAQKSWQTCHLFNGYGSFSRAGGHYVFGATSPRTLALAGSLDLQRYASLTFDAGGAIRFMWVEGSQRGEGALLTWGAARDCELGAPVTFYAAHAVLDDAGALEVRDVSVVAAGVAGTCGHYMGNDLGPDGRAYLVVHSSPTPCLDFPTFVPGTHAPWLLFVQDGGPRR